MHPGRSASPPEGGVIDPPTRPTRWERVGLVALRGGTAAAYLWNITVNGMGNQFYAAAAQTGSVSWKALLFGSLDRANFIAIDKPPVSQWVMGLSGQIFGFGSASMLVPQALMAVASVALLHAAVARLGGRGAGLLTGAALALTPVAALMFRFGNPDAVMVLLMTAGAYCTVRSLERASGRWIALAGVALGFAFLSKMLEGLLPMPALAVAFLVAAPISLRARLVRLLGALAALLVVAGLFAIGVHEMWARRATWFGRSGLAGIIAVTGAWSFWILGRDATQKGAGAPGGRPSAHQDVADWVAGHFTPVTVGSTTVYDLSGHQG